MQDTIDEFLSDVNASKSQGTFEARRRDLRHYNKYLKENSLSVTSVDSYSIHKYLRDQGQEYSTATIASRYSSIKLLYDFLTGIRDVMDDHPMDDLSRSDYSGNGKSKHNQEELVYVTPEEIELLCENVSSERALRDELIIRIIFQTGIRRGEAATIKLDDINRSQRTIRIYSDKTDSWRNVYYKPSLDRILDLWLNSGFRDALHQSNYLFPTNESEHISPNRLNQRIKLAAENAGIQEVLHYDAAGNRRHRITAHSLRHGHGVEALKSGIDTKFIQEHLGHEKIETTERYLQVIDEDVRTAYSKFGSR